MSTEIQEKPREAWEDDAIGVSQGMSLWESVRIAWRALASNKMRAGLTMLGIIIGIFAVITMVSMGQSASGMITQQINNLGTNLLLVMPGNPRARGPQQGTQPTLTAEDAHVMETRFRSTIALLAPQAAGSAQVKMGDKGTNTQIAGTTPSYAAVSHTAVRAGRFLTEQDVSGRTKVAVVGPTVVYHLLGDKSLNPVGKTIAINRISFQIVGVLAEKGSGLGQDQDDIIIIPVTTALRRVFNRTWINLISVQCVSPDSMDRATEQISNLLRQRHHLHPPFPDNDDFAVGNQSSILKAFGTISGTLTLLLGGLATISLLVGGIGIMNIMLVSVTERTREIGLRKSVGATRSDILTQFLIEAVLLSLIGGFIGMALGIGVTAAIVALLGWTLVISPGVVVLATVVSAGIGILFGSYPAAKAARQNPIDALRYE